MTKTRHLPLLEYGVSSVIIPGQNKSGDLYIVKETAGHALVGVVDGLGHGSEAAAAAELAVHVLDTYSQESVIAIAKFCHKELKETRGVVMALASINSFDDTLTWLSIGNVEGMLLRSDPNSNPVYESIIMRPGVIGFRLPPLYASVMSIAKGDILIFSTDGISDDYIQRIASDAQYSYGQYNKSEVGTSDVQPKETEAGQNGSAYSTLQSKPDDPNLFRGGGSNISPQQLADYICRRFNKGNDDALVTVAKYL